MPGKTDEARKCFNHTRRAAKHELLGIALCDACARVAAKAAVNLDVDDDDESSQLQITAGSFE
jgi:hypothetical protein